MSRREKEKKASLTELARFAYSVSGGAPARPPPPQARASSLPPQPPEPAPKPQPTRPRDAEAERRRRLQAEERRAKMEEERMLRARREAQLRQNANLEWRGMSIDGVPTSIRRTGFDVVEPSVQQKIQDILGEAREKEGRAKNREKGRRR